MIILKYNGLAFVKRSFVDNSVNSVVKSDTIINIRYVRVSEYEVTVFFAFPNEDIVHFATWNNSFSGGLQNIFNNILKNIVN